MIPARGCRETAAQHRFSLWSFVPSRERNSFLQRNTRSSLAAFLRLKPIVSCRDFNNSGIKFSFCVRPGNIFRQATGISINRQRTMESEPTKISRVQKNRKTERLVESQFRVRYPFSRSILRSLGWNGVYSACALLKLCVL
jgi:hypothetical protein